MKLKKFTKFITDEINVECVVEYGHIGTGYIQILTIKDNKIITIGQFLYYLYVEYSYDTTIHSLLSELGKEANKYYNNERKSVPSLHHISDSSVRLAVI